MCEAALDLRIDGADPQSVDISTLSPKARSRLPDEPTGHYSPSIGRASQFRRSRRAVRAAGRIRAALVIVLKCQPGFTAINATNARNGTRQIRTRTTICLRAATVRWGFAAARKMAGIDQQHHPKIAATTTAHLPVSMAYVENSTLATSTAFRCRQNRAAEARSKSWNSTSYVLFRLRWRIRNSHVHQNGISSFDTQ